MTNDVITRRTVFAAAAGAAGALLVSPVRADDKLLQKRGPYRIEDWGKTWRNPNKERVLARVPAVAMPDIAGYWPQTTRPVRGPQEYAKRIIDLLDFIPDFSAEPIEHVAQHPEQRGVAVDIRGVIHCVDFDRVSHGHPHLVAAYADMSS